MLIVKTGHIIVRTHSTNYDEQAFVNNNGYHSINVEAIRDFQSKSLLIFPFFEVQILAHLVAPLTLLLTKVNF